MTPDLIDELCATCNGRGHDIDEDGGHRCPDCNGKGIEPQPVWLILDGDDDLAARARSEDEALGKLSGLRDYWAEAADCGHPVAAGFAHRKTDGAFVERVRASEAEIRWDDTIGYLDLEP